MLEQRSLEDAEELLHQVAKALEDAFVSRPPGLLGLPGVDGYWREHRDLSGGERTDIALAYRIGLGNAIYEARTGMPLELLILDEPTESLGNEDRSIERLARTLANLKVRQVIAITHDQTFARFADNTIEIRKIGNKSELITS